MTAKSIGRKALFKIFPSLDPDRYRLEFVNKSPSEIFSTIYKKKLWGGRLLFDVSSGSGSRDPDIIFPYVEAVGRFLRGLVEPTVVDIGCGDFNVGNQLVRWSGRYIACDVVNFIVARNRRKYPDVEFHTLDAVSDELPCGDVVLIRQVLQHLSNEQVSKILPKICSYKYAVITEHIPGFADFVPNLDKETGADLRANFGSGLVLTKSPFNLKAQAIQILCEVEEFGGLIRTTLFECPSV